ncbi:hypothetical protein B0A48_05518 [Cryoendolithus antarcticus]|uniref:DUF747-domain-containing protein n=1 Tax=Cryoendolithus antarcticus TaxID=1507870 RepID=A0A1V8TJ72_9PEZI|nr:hypothetical protein B0A48_05518 [Cryoendolithus antarcticus]
MNGSHESGTPNSGHDGSRNTGPNGQLVTPALTPISEHGDRGLDDVFSGGGKQPNGLSRPDGTQRSDPPRELFQSVAGLDDGVEGSTRSPTTNNHDTPKASKLSPAQIFDLVSSPGSIPMRLATPVPDDIPQLPPSGLGISQEFLSSDESLPNGTEAKAVAEDSVTGPSGNHLFDLPPTVPEPATTQSIALEARRRKAARSASSPNVPQKVTARDVRPQAIKIDRRPSRLDGDEPLRPKSARAPLPSPMPAVIPLPPLSLPTYLQLELSSSKPSPLYIHRPLSSDFPYESSQIKFERLLNFLLIPPQVEQVLVFGALACLDSWLYTFTILPLRFLKAILILVQYWWRVAVSETRSLSAFVYQGLGRVWQRRRMSVDQGTQRPSLVNGTDSRRASALDVGAQKSPRPDLAPHVEQATRTKTRSGFRHRRSRSVPSALLPNHKADLLQGALIIISCLILLRFDASRMYHSIRGQAAIKLYVIYNVLEVFDRLFSALGQDILECLFSKETLERSPDGRSKIIRPFWMFMLALLYNVVHATALLYQVVTLNVAVNSYSNALLTLLMSNQFVEIKSTVFKKFEKENLFQLTCADVVERFQLWLMLLVIALRNIVEVGGITASFNALTSTSANAANSTSFSSKASIIPRAFTLTPRWTGEVLGPFLIVLGSEMLVDWLKHAYITKFNNVKPAIYGRFLDVLAKDYYSHAFADQNLTKRLGLPVIPLSCLFIRASMQTYSMFIATHIPPIMPSTATSVSLEDATTATSSATMAAIEHIDHIFRRAIGRSSFGTGSETGTAAFPWSLDDAIALATMAIFFLVLYLILLAFKLVLGMALLSFSRRRYIGMKARERDSTDTKGKPVGGWGVVEVGEEKRRWIYDDDPDALRNLREREAKAKAKADRGAADELEGVGRYMMAAKRIW